MPRHARVLFVLVTVLLLALAAGSVLTPPEKPKQLQPVCSPPLGRGEMGICAPRVHAPATSAPRVLHGLLGVDLSNHQGCGTHDLGGLAFAFFKANESTGFRDRCAADNVRTAKRLKLPHGLYDFLRPGRSTAGAEAATFVSVYHQTGASGPAVADVEANDRGLSQAAMRAYVCDWAAAVHRELPRASVIVYTGTWFWTPQVAGPACVSTLWIAAYGNSFGIPTGFKSATIWQYSDGQVGPLPHIHRWDSDLFLGSRAELEQLFNPPEPVPPERHAQCAELRALRLKAQRVHKKTGHWLAPKDRQRRVQLAKDLHDHGFTCSNGRATRLAA